MLEGADVVRDGGGGAVERRVEQRMGGAALPVAVEQEVLEERDAAVGEVGVRVAIPGRVEQRMGNPVLDQAELQEVEHRFLVPCGEVGIEADVEVFGEEPVEGPSFADAVADKVDEGVERAGVGVVVAVVAHAEEPVGVPVLGGADGHEMLPGRHAAVGDVRVARQVERVVEQEWLGRERRGGLFRTSRSAGGDATRHRGGLVPRRARGRLRRLFNHGTLNHHPNTITGRRGPFGAAWAAIV